MKPSNTAVLLLAVAGVYMLSRLGPATKTTNTPGPVGALRYETPTTVAERLARIVNTLTTAAKPAAPTTDLYASAATELLDKWTNPSNVTLSLHGWLSAGGADTTDAADAVLSTPVYDVGDALAVPLFWAW